MSPAKIQQAIRISAQGDLTDTFVPLIKFSNNIASFQISKSRSRRKYKKRCRGNHYFLKDHPASGQHRAEGNMHNQVAKREHLVLLNINSCSYNVSFGHLETLSHSIFSILKLQPAKTAVHLLVLHLVFAGCLHSCTCMPTQADGCSEASFCTKIPS